MIELELFKAGDYPQGTFTDEDVKEIADAYDPAIHEAPLVVGHKTNKERAQSGEPSHGWFQKLKAVGGTLYGVLPDMSEWAKSALTTTHKKWSVELYPALKEAGGKKYLKAVALLGAAAPAIKGLKPVQFKDDTESIVISQEGKTMPDPITATDLEKSEGRIMAFMKGLVHKFSDPPDDEPNPPAVGDESPDIKTALDAMSNNEMEELLNEIADHPKAQEIAAALEQEAEEAHLAEQEKDPNFKFRVDTQKKQIADWVDAQIKSGHLTPAAKDAGVVSFMEMLAFADSETDDGTIKFTEKGDAVTPLAFFQSIVEKHIAVPKGEIAPDEKGEKAPTIPINLNFNERAEGRTKEMLDTESVAFAEKSHKYAKDNKVSLADAMIALSPRRT